LELLSFLCPFLGLVFWAVYANTKPYKAHHIGVCGLIGAGVGIALFVSYKVILTP
jgi:hypothetical protein